MPFAARDAATIRATILANRRARYLARNRDLSVVEGSDAYIEADADAIELELLEQRALALTLEIFPDTASPAFLAKHAALIGLARKPATRAQIPLTLTGTIGAAWATTDALAAADGNTYRPTTAGVIGGGGTAAIVAEAQTAGAAGNKAAGATLTWQAAPTGLAATATVAAGTPPVVAADQEDDDALKARVLRWWLERPGSGNRADVVDWVESRPGVARGFVFPLYHHALGPHTLGAFVAQVLGDPAARTAAAPLGIGQATADDAAAYLLGTGVYAADGGRLAVNVDPDDAVVELPATQAQDVTVRVLEFAPPDAFPFVGGFSKAADAGNTPARVYLNGPPTPIDVGDYVAIDSSSATRPTGFVRGYFEVRRVVAKSTAPNYIDLDAPLGGVPDDGRDVLPAPANWVAIAAAVLAIFDRLGPGDVAAALYPESARWPTSTMAAPAKLYNAALLAAVMGVPGYAVGTAPATGTGGVVSADVSTPAGDVTPPARTVLIPGRIRITP